MFEQEHLSSCATVLMVDVSHSMILYGEDRITPAKKIALALTQLIQTRYPKDTLDVVLFGDDATAGAAAGPDEDPGRAVSTRTPRAGLQLAQRILDGRKGVNKQIFMITDGKPSAIREYGRLYKNPFGLDPKIVNKTLEEAAYCRTQAHHDHHVHAARPTRRCSTSSRTAHRAEPRADLRDRSQPTSAPT